MAAIIPAIIGSNFTEVENQIRLIERQTRWVHLDVMDGTFTRESSWRTPDDLVTLDGQIKIEVHLMIRSPEAVIKNWAAAADRVLIHIEAAEYLTEILDFFTASPAEPGLALNLQTSLSVIEQWVDKVELVQLMAIAEIGEQGHPFDERVIEKIKLLRQSYPSVKIQVDGGVNLNNAQRLIEAGADNLVVGSAVWQSPDPLAILRQLQSLQF